MATGNQLAWENMQSKIMAMGGVPAVVIGEPRREAQSGLVALIPLQGEVDETVLDAPREIHRISITMYRKWLEDPEEETEFELDKFRAEILEDIFGNFTLGGKVSHVLPAETDWNYDEAEVGNTLYRVINIIVSYRIDENATFAA